MVTSAVSPSSLERPAVVAPAWHTGVVLLLQVGLGILGWLRLSHAPPAAEFHRVGAYLRTMAGELLVLAVVVWGVWRSGSSLREIFGPRWNSYLQFLRDIGLGLAFWIASTVFLSLLFGHGHSSSSIALLLPRTFAEKCVWLLLSFAAGICEEAIFRGYWQKQFAAFTQSAVAGIAASAVLFGAAHLYQGSSNALMIATQGLLLGLLAFWRRSVRPGMISHFAQDAFAGVLASALRVPIR